MAHIRAKIGVFALFLVIAVACYYVAQPKTVVISPSYGVKMIGAPLINVPKPHLKKTNIALVAWIEALSRYECTGDCIGNPSYRRIDSNGLYSYGCLQFQLRTWDLFHSSFKSHLDGSLGIYSCAAQKDLAYLMIEHDYAAWNNWYTSVVDRGLGFPPQG